MSTPPKTTQAIPSNNTTHHGNPASAVFNLVNTGAFSCGAAEYTDGDLPSASAQVVDRGGIDPPTFRFSGGRSSD
jgi:hypothetical protein